MFTKHVRYNISKINEMNRGEISDRHHLMSRLSSVSLPKNARRHCSEKSTQYTDFLKSIKTRV